MEDDEWREEDHEKSRLQQEEDKVRTELTSRSPSLPFRLVASLLGLLFPQRALEAKLNTLRQSHSAFEAENISLAESLSSQERQSKHTITLLSNDVHLLKSRLESSEQESQEYKEKSQELSVEVKSLRTKVGELVEELEKVRRDEGDDMIGSTLRQELHREFGAVATRSREELSGHVLTLDIARVAGQSKNLHNQATTLASQKAEIIQLRQRKDNVEALRIEMDSNERAWADKCRQLEAQADRLRADLRFVDASSFLSSFGRLSVNCLLTCFLSPSILAPSPPPPLLLLTPPKRPPSKPNFDLLSPFIKRLSPVSPPRRLSSPRFTPASKISRSPLARRSACTRRIRTNWSGSSGSAARGGRTLRRDWNWWRWSSSRRGSGPKRTRVAEDRQEWTSREKWRIWRGWCRRTRRGWGGWSWTRGRRRARSRRVWGT